MKNNFYRTVKRLIKHGIIGAMAGYFVLHPVSMYIHVKFQQCIIPSGNFLEEIFSKVHFPMAIYFIGIGMLGGIIHGLYAIRLVGLLRKLEELSITDELTKIFNRRYFMNQLNKETERAQRYEHSLSLMMIDIDYFKQYNDDQGHQKGDELLKQFSAYVKKRLRKNDLWARYGGEEFAIIMPDTSKEKAISFANGLREKIQNYRFGNGTLKQNSKITISAGIAEIPSDCQSMVNLISVADSELYNAKRNGRNKVYPVAALKL